MQRQRSFGRFVAIIGGTVALATAAGAQAGRAPTESKSSAIKAAVTREDGRIRITYQDARSGIQGSVILPPATQAVNNVIAADDGYFIVVGDVGGAEEIALIDEAKQVVSDRTYARNTAISPDEALIVFRKFRPRAAPPTSDEYSALSVRASSAVGSLQTRPISMVTTKTHMLRSAIQWIRPDVVAFLDYTPGEVALVAAELDPRGEVQRSAVKVLPIDRLVNLNVVDEGKPPALGVSGATITEIGVDGGLTVRLTFRTQVEMKAKRVDVVVWQ